MEGKRKRKTATNHHNKQQQLAPPPYPSPKGRGVKCNESNWPHPPQPLPHREGSRMRDTPMVGKTV